MTIRCPTCGHESGGKRSHPDHARFFALVAAAFSHWPESEKFQPTDVENLRGYLLCRAGYCTKQDIVFDKSGLIGLESKRLALTITAACRGALLATGGRGYLNLSGDRVTLYVPKSISWGALSQKDFGEIRDRVTSIIENILAVTASELLENEREPGQEG